MAIYSLLLLIVLIILILIVLLIFEVVFVVFVLYLSILKIVIKVAVNDIFVIILLLLILVGVGEIADEVRIHLLLSKHSLLRRRILLILFVAGERVFLHFSIACLL